MSEPQPEPGTVEDGEEPPNIELQDPDDFHRRRRLKEIHSRREQVTKTLDEMDLYTETEEHTRNRLRLGMAITAYIAELEPLIERTDASPELPERLPWDDVVEYADLTGRRPDGEGDETVGYRTHVAVYRACNQYLGEVRPLVEEDDDTEWEV